MDWIDEHENEQWGSYGKDPAVPEHVGPSPEELAEAEARRVEELRQRKITVDVLRSAIRRKWSESGSEGLEVIEEDVDYERNGIHVYHEVKLVHGGKVIATLYEEDWDNQSFEGNQNYQYDLETWFWCDPNDIETYAKWAPRTSEMEKKNR